MTLFVFFTGMLAGFAAALGIGAYRIYQKARPTVPVFVAPEIPPGRAYTADGVPTTPAELDALIASKGSVAQTVLAIGHDRLLAMPITMFGWLMTRLATELAAHANAHQVAPPAATKDGPIDAAVQRKLRPWSPSGPMQPPSRNVPHEGPSMDPRRGRYEV